MATWRLEGPYMKKCNCDPGCPCDFSANPTHGNCEGMAAMSVEQGYSMTSTLLASSGRLSTGGRARYTKATALARAAEELVVESAAYTVCGAPGLDSSGYSIPYLAS